MTDRVEWQAKQARYMSKALYAPGDGEDLTIRDCREELFKNHSGAEERKLVLDWMEERPALSLNKTNFAWLVSTFGGNDDSWIRKRVRVFHDPTVRFGKELVGGLVLDTPSQKVAPGPDKALQQALKRADIAKAKGLDTGKPQEPDDDLSIPF